MEFVGVPEGVLRLVEVRTRRVKLGLRRKVVGLLHLEGLEDGVLLVPAGGAQVERVVGVETGPLS